MTTKPSSVRKESVRPTQRCREAGPVKALVGPRTLSQALNKAVPAKRRQQIAQASGGDAQVQKLTFEPSWRALLVRQLVGGSLRNLQHGMVEDSLYEVYGARVEISVPGLSKANAQRPTQPFGDVLAEVMGAVEALPQAVRLGREKPLGAATPKEERAGIKVQLRVRAGYGGGDRVTVTGAKGNDNLYFRAMLDLESARPGRLYLFDTGYCKLATSDQLREQSCDLVTVRHESITVAVVEERGVDTPVTTQGDVLHSDRRVRLGAGATRSRYLWRVIEATDTQGQRRTILSSLRAETAERITRLRAYRWTIEIVFRWLKQALQLEELISVSPAGIEMQVAVALITYGLLLLQHEGGPALAQSPAPAPPDGPASGHLCRRGGGGQATRHRVGCSALYDYSTPAKSRLTTLARTCSRDVYNDERSGSAAGRAAPSVATG